MPARMSRALNLVYLGVAFSALLVGAPISLAQSGRRRGWSGGRPGAINVAGALPLSAGTLLLLWTLSCHYRAAPQGWRFGLSPDYLLATGPYRFSRNPMYLGEAAIWAGWTVWFGSLPVATGLLGLTAVQNGVIRLEEQVLLRRWGDAYEEYRATVPRWL